MTFYEICTWFLCAFRGHRFVACVNREFEVQKLDKNPNHTIQGERLGFVICADCGKDHKIDAYTYDDRSRGEVIIYFNGQTLTQKIDQ